MIKKNYSLLLTLLCLLLCLSTADAQKRLWGTLSGGVYHINLDGTGYTTSLDGDDDTGGEFGNWPQGLIQTTDGSIVGVNDSYGPDSGGSLFKISPTGVSRLTYWSYPGAEYVVQGNDGKLRGIGINAVGGGGFRFDINLDGTGYTENYFSLAGFWPDGGLIKASNGNIYGLSTSDPGARGYVYRIDATAASVVQYGSNSVGKRPDAKFIEGPGGLLYAGAQEGGTFGHGTIIRFNIATNALSKIHNFDGANGSKPFGEMAIDASGVLYGVTQAGGTFNKGVIYKINSNGTGFTVLHHFNAEVGMGYVALDGTTLFGHGRTADYSGSFLFKIQTNGSGYAHLYDFPVTSMDTFSEDRLIIVTTPAPAVQLVTPANGATGVATSGTFSSNTILNALSYQLQLSTSPTFTSIAFTFNSSNNNFAVSGLGASTTYYARVKTNVLPGWGATTSFTTSSGAIQKRLWGIGVYNGMFHVKPDGTSFSIYYDGSSDAVMGSIPRDMFQLSDGSILTVSASGGAYEMGTLNKITPGGYIKLLDWEEYPNGAFIHMAEGTDGFVYGTGISATQNSGRIFKIRPDGTGYVNNYFTKYGYWPAGNIIRASDGKFYGMSNGIGGGWMFKINDARTNVDKLFDFTNATGRKPEGGFVEYGGSLYGLLKEAGAFNKGTIFKATLGTTVITKLKDFNGTDGATPKGDMVVSGDGTLYGMTSAGGTFNQGVVFKIKVDGTGYTILHHFDGVAGSAPRGHLILDGNTLYGYAETAGSGATSPILFSIKTDGTGFTVVKQFVSEYVQGNLFMTTAPFSVLAAREPVLPQVDLNEGNVSSVAVHPNPFEREFSIHVKGAPSESVSFMLFDLQGRVISTTPAKANETYQLGESLSSGVYLLKVITAEGTNFYRISKQ